jgi:hypothetical protein
MINGHYILRIKVQVHLMKSFQLRFFYLKALDISLLVFLYSNV